MTGFDRLLCEWVNGAMRDQLVRMGITKPEFYIDWLPDYRCLDIQGRGGGICVNVQVEPDTFSIACDPDEPDDPVEFQMGSSEHFYMTIEREIERMGTNAAHRQP